MNEYKIKQDCRNFLGTRPCEIMFFEGMKNCIGCKFYEPIKKRISIIKLGAAGDVLRTTTILPPIKEKYGYDTSITWIVDKENEELLKNNQYIDKILVYNLDNLIRLNCQNFDILFSLDVDIPGTALAKLINAKEKFGFYLDKKGIPKPFNQFGKYYLERACLDEINRNNQKTYQQMIFEICSLKYNQERYILNLSEKSIEYSKNFSKSLDQNKKTIGINLGSGKRFPSRMIASDKIIELISLLKDYNVFILGGPGEKKEQREIFDKLKSINILVHKNNTNNTKEEFIGVLNLCDLIITGDSMAMHLGIGLNKKVVALFFSTPPAEIETYDLMRKIISSLNKSHLYFDEYSKELVNSISPLQIFEEVKKML